MNNDRDLKVITRYRGEIQSGLAAQRIAESNRSADRMNYRHMVPARSYGDVVSVLGQAARLGDIYADACSKALTKISPFQNDWQMMAGVADAFSHFIRTPWNDTREATGPEAGRPSSHVKDVNEHTAATLHLILCEIEYSLQLGHAPGPGWCLLAIARELKLSPSIRTALPRVYEAITKEN